MYDTGKVVLGILVFLGLMTFPIWYGAFFGEAKAEPQLIAQLEADGTPCAVAEDVAHERGEDASEMSRDERAQLARVEHMALLDVWRNEVVREGKRMRVTAEARRDRPHKSLSNTCLSCHTNKTRFCDTCHDYAGVAPYCWDCHVDPTAVAGR